MKCRGSVFIAAIYEDLGDLFHHNDVQGGGALRLLWPFRFK